jgi:integrase
MARKKTTIEERYPYRARWHDEHGRRHDVRAATKKELQQKVLEKKLRIADAARGHVVISSKMTVRAWAAKWLETYKQPTVSATTFKDYQHRIDSILLHLEGMRLIDVKGTHLQAILNGMDGFSKDRTIKMRLTIKQLFSRAVDDGLLVKNPAVNLIVSKAAKDGTRRSITPYERQITLLTAETHHAGVWILTMLYTGLRPQETAALRGRHINLKTMEIHVEEALKSDGTIGATKTGAGKRTVPLPPELRPYFSKTKPFDFCFTSFKGRPLSRKNMSAMWTSFKRQMQIEAGCKVYRNALVPPYPIADDLVPYCFRHTYCTDLQDAGIPINVAKDLMGHSSIAVTSKIYTHMTEAQFQSTAEKIHAFRNNNRIGSEQNGKVISIG